METAMGDVYAVVEVRHEGKRAFVGRLTSHKGWCRVVCTPTPLRWVAESYFDDVNAAQADALRGVNPYVTAAYAHEYLAESRRIRR